MGLFRALTVIMFCGIFFYIAHQLLRFTGLPLSMTLGVLFFLSAMFGVIIAMPLYFWVERRKEHKPWYDSFFDAAHFAIAYMNFLVSLVIIRDVLAFISHYFVSETAPEWMQPDSLYGQTALGIMLVLPLMMILVGTIAIRVGPKLKLMELRFADLPPAWDGVKILHITDLHISPSLPVNFVSKLLKVIEQAKADLIVYTGDILDSQAVRHLEEFGLLKTVRPPLGNYYVPGNHEYYWDIDQGLAAFRSVDFNVLINQVATLERQGQYLQIAGVPDPAALHFGAEGPDFRKTASHFLPNSFRIMLSHQPSLGDLACEHGVQLQLSGHTHGGQFFPWNLLIGFFQKYPKGLYHIKNMRLYVNQGTGYWGPSLRMGTYCEITEIILRKG